MQTTNAGEGMTFEQLYVVRRAPFKRTAIQAGHMKQEINTI
jgi:hypothetical protein